MESRFRLGNDGKKLEVKVFDGIPVQSLFILEPETESEGIMRVEPYAYGIRKEDRRIQELSRRHEQKLFDTYFCSFNKMWDRASMPEVTSA